MKPSSPSVVAEREVKGLYEKALAGEIDHFTGVSDPNEPPEHPALTIHTHVESLDESAGKMIELLKKKNLA
jgi:adenylylsulfate kinase-like enzyme